MSFESNLPILAIVFPFASAFIIGLLGKRLLNLKRAVAVLATLVSLLCIIFLYEPIVGRGEIATYWMGNWAAKDVKDFWAIGIGLEVDGLGWFVGLIIGVTVFLSSIYSIRYMEKDNGLDKYYTLFLLLAGSMMGFVLTGDLFNMYVMIEIMTFAAVALTSFRNGLYKSIEAGFKYIVIGSVGSSFILLGTVLLYAETHTLNLAQIAAVLQGKPYSAVTILALALMLTGYAVKAFLVPCHTWPPDAHMAAPSSISMLLSGVMSKTGVYALIRILYIIFESTGRTEMQLLIIFWGTITMVLGVTMAMIQTDFKRLLAFSSVSQIGYIVVALGVGLSDRSNVAVLGTMGGLYHMLNHAMFKCLLFLCAGAVLYRAGTTDLTKLGGLSKKMPVTTALFLIGTAAISGIPPFNGFVSKWLIYQSTYEAGFAPITVLALLCSVMTFASLVKVGQSVFFGEATVECDKVKEVPWAMRIPMIILALVCIIGGIAYNAVSKYLIQPAANAIYNIGNYIDVMFKEGYAEEMIKEKIIIPDMTAEYAGYWKPEAWLALFFVLLIGAIVVLSINIRSAKKKTINVVDGLDMKFDSFTGGEVDEHAPIGGQDLFWGIRHQLKLYFDGIYKAHSGLVNDYVLWVVTCLAVVTIYLFAVI
ncbi:proton-conducting transporter membrane subunit [Clostridium thermarum]|uniref:proton-conducting transporter transmembrane domain-containing protein n=1 Tax=Clostridium thermarum TaxID=1716543 RepID=UPI00111D5C1F|nr:proton-conducting transporter membrane subunit [Clostridium thermarum]